jgi:hypothetical protein
MSGARNALTAVALRRQPPVASQAGANKPPKIFCDYTQTIPTDGPYGSKIALAAAASAVAASGQPSSGVASYADATLPPNFSFEDENTWSFPSALAAYEGSVNRYIAEYDTEGKEIHAVECGELEEDGKNVCVANTVNDIREEAIGDIESELDTAISAVRANAKTREEKLATSAMRRQVNKISEKKSDFEMSKEREENTYSPALVTEDEEFAAEPRGMTTLDDVNFTVKISEEEIDNQTWSYLDGRVVFGVANRGAFAKTFFGMNGGQSARNLLTGIKKMADPLKRAVLTDLLNLVFGPGAESTRLARVVKDLAHAQLFDSHAQLSVPDGIELRVFGSLRDADTRASTTNNAIILSNSALQINPWHYDRIAANEFSIAELFMITTNTGGFVQPTTVGVHAEQDDWFLVHSQLAGPINNGEVDMGVRDSLWGRVFVTLRESQPGAIAEFFAANQIALPPDRQPTMLERGAVGTAIVSPEQRYENGAVELDPGEFQWTRLLFPNNTVLHPRYAN